MGQLMPIFSSQSLGHESWRLVERTHDTGRAGLHETLFALGNGRIGVRGSHEEGDLWPGTTQDSVYINGFHDTESIYHPEVAFGLASQNQFLVEVPNGKLIRWAVGDEAFDPRTGSIENYRRVYDMREASLCRSLVWTSPGGKRVSVQSRRIACMEQPQLYVIEFSVMAMDEALCITIESSLDARSKTVAATDDPRLGSTAAGSALVRIDASRDGDSIMLVHRTRHSGLLLASAVAQQVDGGTVASQPIGEADCPGTRYRVQLAANERVVLTKYCALVSSMETPSSRLARTAADLLHRAASKGFDKLLAEQCDALERWWQDADVEIEGDELLQQGMRFNLLHLLQSAGRDGRTNIAAKGVTGSGYDGHYFWDTEIYVFPVLLHTRPELARKLLAYRFHTLGAARDRARELNHPQGALFPWRTIAGGECSAYFPAGTAQIHINADIAHAVKRYWEATGDDAFMADMGAELVFETARIWLSHGAMSCRGGAESFQIHTVTGPDEYTALVDNNFYTNAMAQMHLRFAHEVAHWLAAANPAADRRIQQRIGLDAGEPARWRAAADLMYLPYDSELGIHPQDDGFLSKPRWDLSAAGTRRPLLLHYHPLVIYRHQVCKQADVLLALLLLGDQFKQADKKRDFDYYEPLTTHDSSLSRCIFGIVASEVGYASKAYDYFVDGVRTDLDDHHGNTVNGVHTAAMAGAWHGVVAGFGGLRMRRGVPAFAPQLPNGWKRYAFKLKTAGAQLRVCVDHLGTHYQLLHGAELSLMHRGETVLLTRAAPRASFPVPSPLVDERVPA
ncbi:MAG: glycoside hydrolase family 65 protein [Proteobacteria bacterium]|nr:glycoside hydrolase family 65 protein [Pseudomonadota bacterium]